jgi:hypothetical protein
MTEGGLSGIEGKTAPPPKAEGPIKLAYLVNLAVLFVLALGWVLGRRE